MTSFGIFQPSDANLVKKALNGQPQAFELLVLRYHNKAHAIARRSSDRWLDGEHRRDQIIAAWAEGLFLLEVGRTASGAGGAFRLGSLEPVPQDLKVEKDGYAPARLSEVSAGSEWIQVVLPRGLCIQGRVLDPGLRPLEGAEVLLAGQELDRPRPPVVGQPDDPKVPADPEAEAARGTATGADGRFAFNGLAGGAFDLEVKLPGFPPAGRRSGSRRPPPTSAT